MFIFSICFLILFQLTVFADAAAATCTTTTCGAASCCSTASGPQCYSSSTYTCVDGTYLCPVGYGACNGACYNTAAYSCESGQLVQTGSGTTSSSKASTSSSTAATTASTSSKAATTTTTTSSSKAATTTTSTSSKASTTSSSTAKASTSKSATTTKASTTSSSTASTASSSSSSAATTGSAGVCTHTNCGAASCCPDVRNGEQCYTPSNYDCVNGRYLCGKGQGICGDACYDPKAYSCSSGNLVPAGSSGTSTTGSVSSSTSKSTSSSSSKSSSSSSSTTSKSSSSSSSTTGSSTPLRLDGLNYNVRQSGDACPSQATVDADIRIISAVADRVRLYSLVDCTQGAMVLQAIINTGSSLRVGLGMWLDTYHVSEFANEYNALIEIINQFGLSNVDIIVVGSETQYRADFSADELVGYIRNISTTVKVTYGYSSIKVATADVIFNLINSPFVIAAGDVVIYNEFPFWEGVAIDGAFNTLKTNYQQIVDAAQGKQIIIGETGWPDAGPTTSAAIPDQASENTYLHQVTCWAHSQGIRYFWFAAFDDAWRFTDDQRHWGLHYSNRALKGAINLNIIC